MARRWMKLSLCLPVGPAGIPFGTVTPEQAFEPTAVMLTYRNFGEISLNGLDVNLGLFPERPMVANGQLFLCR